MTSGIRFATQLSEDSRTAISKADIKKQIEGKREQEEEK